MKYIIMVAQFDNDFHETYTYEYDGVIYDDLSTAIHQLKTAKKTVLYDRLVCDVFIKEVTQ